MLHAALYEQSSGRNRLSACAGFREIRKQRRQCAIQSRKLTLIGYVAMTFVIVLITMG